MGVGITGATRPPPGGRQLLSTPAPLKSPPAASPNTVTRVRDHDCLRLDLKHERAVEAQPHGCPGHACKSHTRWATRCPVGPGRPGVRRRRTARSRPGTAPRAPSCLSTRAWMEADPWPRRRQEAAAAPRPHPPTHGHKVTPSRGHSRDPRPAACCGLGSWGSPGHPTWCSPRGLGPLTPHGPAHITPKHPAWWARAEGCPFGHRLGEESPGSTRSRHLRGNPPAVLPTKARGAGTHAAGATGSHAGRHGRRHSRLLSPEPCEVTTWPGRWLRNPANKPPTVSLVYCRGHFLCLKKLGILFLLSCFSCVLVYSFRFKYSP